MTLVDTSTSTSISAPRRRPVKLSNLPRWTLPRHGEAHQPNIPLAVLGKASPTSFSLKPLIFAGVEMQIAWPELSSPMGGRFGKSFR